jgi:hypothetical protein
VGAVLEMSLGSRGISLVLLALLAAGCGTERQGPAAQVVQNVQALFQSGPKAAPPGPDDLLTRDVIDQVTVPYAMVGIERRGAYASMTLAGINRDYESWVTSDGAGVILKDGLLTGTKGLGADLLTADVGGLDGLVNGGAGDSVRVHRFLDGEGRIFALNYSCSLAKAGNETITIIGKTYATRVVKESCVSDQGSFENSYWIGRSDGVMWQSRQWVSEGVGHILLLNLVPVAR